MFLFYHKGLAYVQGDLDVILFSLMKTTRKLKLFLIVCLLLAACAPQTPIAVYVTPTPQPSLAQTTPEVQGSLVKPTEISSASRLGFTLTSMQTGPTTEPQPTVTWFGPVVGPGYVLPPTSTPQPTTPPPTVEGQQQPTSQTPAGVNLPNGMPDLDPSKIGIQIDSNLQQSDWDAAMADVGPDKLGIKWIKLQIPWRDMQPNGPQDISPAFQRLVLYLQDAKRRQLNVMISVAKAPLWARPTQDQDGPPSDPQLYANFLTLFLTQVKGSVDAVEIWNEPNLIREWSGGLPFNGAGYMRLFIPAYNAIRAYSPSIQIVTAGLAPTGNSAGSVDDRTYLQQMYANGLGNYHDIAIGIHPYSWANSPDSTCCSNKGWDDDPHFFFSNNIKDYRQIMVTNGHSDMQMWVTEFGWATWEGFPGQPPTGSEWMSRNSKWDQANYTIRAFQIGQQTPFIGPMILWNLDFATLAGLIANRDERVAYSIVIPGSSGQLDPNSKNRTERPLFWMLYDAVRPDVHLNKYD